VRDQATEDFYETSEILCWSGPGTPTGLMPKAALHVIHKNTKMHSLHKTKVFKTKCTRTNDCIFFIGSMILKFE